MRDITQTFIIFNSVLIFLFFSQISDLCKLNGVLNLLIVIFLMEAFFGGVVYLEDVRSTAFITLEPCDKEGSTQYFFIGVDDPK